jgi:pyridoxal phosphate enzyme (YggS family)
LGARDDIERNLERVRARMDEAAMRSGRSCGSVRLVAVTKTVGVEEVRILLELGVTEFGENRVDEARLKVETIGSLAQWHMIGSVQRRKAGEVVDLFACVDSVDRVELAEALERKCAERGKVMPVLLEINVSGEASKHGFVPADLPSALDRIRALPHLRVAGLMTMAPFVDDPNEVRPVFAALRGLAEKMGLKELSMGMSNDFEVAIEEGATQVRIGTALFCIEKRKG